MTLSAAFPLRAPCSPWEPVFINEELKLLLKTLLKDRTLPQCPTRAELWPLQAANPEAGVLGNGVLQSHRPSSLIPRESCKVPNKNGFCWQLPCQLEATGLGQAPMAEGEA